MGRIKYVFADVDGVLTDGTVQVDAYGNERKSICYRDLDAVGIGHRAGVKFVFVTGEATEIARFIVRRFHADDAVLGAKDKGVAFDGLLQKYKLLPEEVCYVGDSNRDIPAIEKAGLGAAPADAAPQVLQVAECVTKCRGGEGVLLELVERILSMNEGKGAVVE